MRLAGQQKASGRRFRFADPFDHQSGKGRQLNASTLNHFSSDLVTLKSAIDYKRRKLGKVR